MIWRWWKAMREQWDCFHHTLPTVDTLGGRIPERSLIKSALIDTGRGKMFWCTSCNKRWIV